MLSLRRRLPLLLKRTFRTVPSPIVQLQESLEEQIQKHNSGVNVRRVNRAVSCVTLGSGVFALNGSADALLICLFSSMANFWTLLFAAATPALHPTLALTPVMMPPAAIIRAAHQIDGELAMTSLLRFVMQYPDSMSRDAVWHEKVVREWPTASAATPGSAFMMKKRDEE